MGFLLCLGLWDSLLEGRIKFQKILTAVNQLPQTDTWQEFEESGGDEFREKKASGITYIYCYCLLSEFFHSTNKARVF